MLAEVRVCTLSESQDLEHSDFSENYDTTRVKLKNRHFSAVMLEVTKLTLSKRVVDGLYEVPKPL